jgi:hypothetical protein
MGLNRLNIDKKEIINRNLYIINFLNFFGIEEDFFIKYYISDSDNFLFRRNLNSKNIS